MSRQGVLSRRHLLEDNQMQKFAENRINENISEVISYSSELKSRGKEIDSQDQNNQIKLFDSFIDTSLVQVDISQNNRYGINIEQSNGKSPTLGQLSVSTPQEFNFQNGNISAIESSINKHYLLESGSRDSNNNQNELMKDSKIRKSAFNPISPHHHKNKYNTSQVHIERKSIKNLGTNSKTSSISRNNNNFFIFKQTNLIKKFISNLTNRTRQWIFKRLTDYQFTMIGDQASDYSYFQNCGYITKKSSMFCIIWDILTMLIWTIIIFYIPYNVNYLSQMDSSLGEKQSISITIFLILEILVKLNKAVFQRGVIITDREHILRRYVQKDAVYDTFILILHFIAISDREKYFLEYVLELRLMRMINTYRDIFQQFDQESKHIIFRQISLLVITVLAFINLQGSIFVLIGISQHQKITGIQNIDSLFDKYIAGIYWSTITMTTIGYGDIYPESTVERIYVSIVSLISCGIFGYSISQIGEIVTEIQKKSETFNKKIQALNKLMKSRQLNKNLMYQVIKYHEYLHFEEESIEEEGRVMIESLPKSMKEMITYEMNHKLFYSQKIFLFNFSKTFLDQLSIKVKSMRVGPETEIYKPNVTDQRIYFIHKGNIDLTFEQNNQFKNFASLKKGDMFGEIEFFSQVPRRFGAKSTSVVHLLYIDFEDFYSCLLTSNPDFESFNMIKDQLRLEDNLKSVDKKCESCGKFSHLFLNCNHLQYLPNIDKILNELNKDCLQERQRYVTRNQSRTQNALSNIFKYNIIVQQLQYMNTTISYGNEKDKLEQLSSNVYPQIQEMTDEDSFQPEKELFSQMSSIKKNTKQFDKDVGILNKPQVRTQRMRKPTYKLLEFQLPVNAFEDKLNMQIDDKLLEAGRLNQSIHAQSQNDSNMTGFFGNIGSQPNIQSYTQLPSPKHSQQNAIQSQFSQMIDNQSQKQNPYYIKQQITRHNTDQQAQAKFSTETDNFSTQDANMIQGIINQNKILMESEFDNENDNNFNQLKKQEILWFSEFESLKNYKIYFPHNNSEVVLQKANKKILIRLKKRLKLNQNGSKNNTPKTQTVKRSFQNTDINLIKKQIQMLNTSITPHI